MLLINYINSLVISGANGLLGKTSNSWGFMILDGYCNGYLYYLWVVDGSYNYSWSCHAGKNHATNHLCLRMVFSIARIKMVMTGGAFMAVFCPHSCHIHGLSDLALRELENHGINIWMNCNDFTATLPYFIAFLRLRLAL